VNRYVNRAHLDKWIDENGPHGLSKLVLKSEVSASTIDKVRLGYVPPKKITRRLLCKAVGLKEDELFPICPDDEGLAS